MSPKEQEVAIGELEERVDRLRTLYDQYFLGFEKLVPEVPRKDVERRFAILRKEQIRNTALRFRFNVVTQKFNTYGMYWQRICRQIEEGTYKRHLQRAKKRFGVGGEMRDLAIDVDLGDFEDEDIDMDAILAEADAAVAKYERDASDTVPPPAPEVRSIAGATFTIGGRREVIEDLEPNERDSQPGLRAARPAQLPTGARQPKVIRKVVPQGAEPAPASDRPQPAATPARVPVPTSQPRIAMPIPPGAVRAPAQSSGRLPVANPPMPGRVPVANPPMRPPAGSSPSVGRVPVANPPMRPPAGSSPSIGRIAVPPPPASGRLPAAAPPPKPNAGPPPSDSEPKPSRPSIKPPPPLPSQVAKPKKSE